MSMKEGKRKRGRPMSADPISRKQNMVSSIPRISTPELCRRKPSKQCDVNIVRVKKPVKISSTSSFSSSTQFNNLDKNSSLDPAKKADKKYLDEMSALSTEFPHCSNMPIDKQNQMPQGCSKPRKIKKKSGNKFPIKQDANVSIKCFRSQLRDVF